VGIATAAFTPQGRAEPDGIIPREERGKIMGTMAHLKTVKLKDLAVTSAYAVNNDNVPLADEETAKFIKGLARSCVPDFWGE